MNPTQGATVEAQTPEGTRDPGSSTYRDSAAAWAVLFYLGAAAMSAWGLITMLNYEEIVGGDAYNLQIAATRGVGLICTGIVLALAGVGLMLRDVSSRVAAS